MAPQTRAGTGVSDLEATLTWYRSNLDISIQRRVTLDDARLDIVKLISPGGVRIVLLMRLNDEEPPAGMEGVTEPRAKHLCFEVDDVQEAFEELRRRGITVIQEPKGIPESGEKNCWIADNEGNLIEFIEEPGP